MPNAAVDAETEPDNTSFRLVFESVTCDECGETYPVTRACACGEWAPRDDGHVARRREAVGDLIHRVDSQVVPSTRIEFGDAIGVLSPWIEALFEALNRFGEPGSDAVAFRAEIERIVELRAQVAASGRKRPWLALWDPLALLVDELVQMGRTYIESSMAPDPESAQALEAVGQAHLDEAARQIRIVNARLDWWGLDRTIKLPDSLVAAASAAYDTTGAQNIVDLDRRGMALFQRITGKADGRTGVGVGLLLDLGLVDRAFDESRVFDIARRVYERVDQHRALFLALLDDPAWRADLLNARRLFYESQLTAETLLRRLEGDRRLEADAALRLGARMTERVSAAIVGLTVAADRTVALKRTADYTKVHEAARKAGLGEILLGFDDRIRNADAHADYEVGPDFVALGRNRSNPERVSDEDLADIVLASVESCAAIFAGIDCLIAEEKHAAGEDRLGDLAIEDLLAVLLAASGVHPGRIDFKSDRLEISGSTHGALTVNPLTVVAALGPSIPGGVRRLILRVRRKDGPVAVDVPMESLRRYQRGEGFAKDVAFVEFMGRTTINGRVVFSARHVRFLLTTYMGRYFEAPLEEAQAAGALLAVTARRLKEAELAEGFDAFQAMKRAQSGGPPAPAHLRSSFERLAKNIERPPGPWNDGSGSRPAAAQEP